MTLKNSKDSEDAKRICALGLCCSSGQILLVIRAIIARLRYFTRYNLPKSNIGIIAILYFLTVTVFEVLEHFTRPEISRRNSKFKHTLLIVDLIVLVVCPNDSSS